MIWKNILPNLEEDFNDSNEKFTEEELKFKLDDGFSVYLGYNCDDADRGVSDGEQYASTEYETCKDEEGRYLLIKNYTGNNGTWEEGDFEEFNTFEELIDFIKNLHFVECRLIESLKEETAEEEQEEDLPDVEIEKEIEITEPEKEPKEIVAEVAETETNIDIPEKLEQKAFSEVLNHLVDQYWNLISSLNSSWATFNLDYKDKNKEDILKIVQELNDQATIGVGMLYKAIDLISSETTDLIDQGMEKAEEIIDK